MFQAKNIMVVVDYRQKNHHALPRAIKLAELFQSQLTLVSCIYPEVMNLSTFFGGEKLEQIKQNSLDEKKALLEELAAPFKKTGINIQTRVIWNKNFYKGLLEHIESSDYDLIVKTAHCHSSLNTLLITPTDWHLLRESPVSLFLVKNGQWPESKSILGAIKIQATDEQHHSLNEKIIECTLSLANLCKATPQLVNVFPWPIFNSVQFKHLFDEKGYFDEMKDIHQKAMKKYIDKYQLAEENVHLVEGLNAAEIIPEVISSSQSDILVMGTVGRKGVSGSVIGNTAEKILYEIDCDVLAIKELS